MNMNKKGGNFFEEHVEKIVLAVVGLVCIWLLITRVLTSPNVVGYDNRQFGPGDIDSYIREQARLLEDELNREPEPKQAYEPRAGDFSALIDSAISDINIKLSLPQPVISSSKASNNREYSIPQIGEVQDVEVEHIRAVAYVPTEKIDEENVYGEAEHEPNDIDFVTVEGKFDVAGLRERFYESFAGRGIPDEWRDPCLAKPVFAAVQLQRQELLADGSRSEWQIVPRSKIEHRSKVLEVIEDVEKLPAGGVEVRLLQFEDIELMMDLLQPKAYKIASAGEEWFPPSLHKKYVRYQKERAAEERREARETEREQRGDARSTARTPQTRSMGLKESIAAAYGGLDAYSSSPRKSSARRRRSGRRSERERPEEIQGASKTPSVSDVYDEFEQILLSEKTDLANMEQLVFWAHDDTVEPGKAYRYRTRLGIFNPIAGTNWFSEQYKSFKNKVILWSDFSVAAETVKVPGILYFFPRTVQEASKIVTVTVSRYVLGYWYSEDLVVKLGETVGEVVDYEASEADEQITAPEEIDYSTDAVLVDVVPVKDWSGGKNLRERYYFDMLYSFDGTNIKHLPIKTSYWPVELQVKYNEIKKSEKEPKEPLRSWEGESGRRRSAPRPGDDDLLKQYMELMQQRTR